MGGSNNTDGTTRYAPYVEAHHSQLLTTYATYVASDLYDGQSPYYGHEDLDPDSAFFGTGYLISSFPSLYDMYGKFMAGLDVDALFSQILESTVNSSEVGDLVAAESTMLSDDITANVLPEFMLGARDLNCVMSSSFVVGKSVIAESQVKSISKYSAGLRCNLIPVATDRWKAFLGWNTDVVMKYAEIMKLYYSAKMDATEMNYGIAEKDRLWPFTVLEFQRVALGTLQGAVNTKSPGSSTGAKAIAGALSGASAGAMVAGPVGAGIGGLLGAASAFL